MHRKKRVREKYTATDRDHKEILQGNRVKSEAYPRQKVPEEG